MKDRTASRGKYWCILFCGVLSCLAGCKKESAQPPPAAAPRDFSSSIESEQDIELLADSEPGIGNRSLQQYAGTMDLQNRYISTVMVHLDNTDREADCSGVLLSPRIVITAAHCVCPGPGSGCSKRAFATTVSYGATRDFNYKEELTEKEFHTYAGEVRPHPEFNLLLDAEGTVVSEHANLAIILLDRPVNGAFAPASLADKEAQGGELLVMSGYASKSEEQVGGVYGIRYFRKNVVSAGAAPPLERVTYEQQGPFLYNGFPGGPCFRDNGTKRWLVGIASVASGKDLTFTSVLFHKNWIEQQRR